MLANYEQQMLFDPTATFSGNLAAETSREVSQYTKKKKESGIPAAKHVIKPRAEEKELEAENKSTDESTCDSPESEIENGIIFTFDPFVSHQTSLKFNFFYLSKTSFV